MFKALSCRRFAPSYASAPSRRRIEIDAANFRVIVLLQSCSILLFFQFGQVQGVNCSLARKAHLKNNRIAMT